MPNLKVALISEEFPPFLFGGIGSACYDYAVALSMKGVKTTVLCGRSKNPTIERINTNLQVIRLPLLDLPPRFLWFQLQNVKVFDQHLRDQSLIHIFNPQAGAIVALMKERFHKPIVTSIHGLHLESLKMSLASPKNSTIKDLAYQFVGYPLQVALHDTCLRKTDHTIVCNRSTANELKKIFPYVDEKKLSVVYNGINFNDIGNVDKQENDGPIIYCGRLFWAKGATHFVDALLKLKEAGLEIKAEIYGEGPLRKKLGQIISNKGLSNVKLMGFIPRNDLFQALKKASMVVLPSLYEAQPITLLEAMACKKPVIAFNLPFASEIITPGFNGLLAKPGDINDLAQKIRILLHDSELRTRLGENGHTSVRERHDWNSLTESTLKIYEKVLNK